MLEVAVVLDPELVLVHYIKKWNRKNEKGRRKNDESGGKPHPLLVYSLFILEEHRAAASTVQVAYSEGKQLFDLNFSITLRVQQKNSEATHNISNIYLSI